MAALPRWCCSLEQRQQSLRSASNMSCERPIASQLIRRPNNSSTHVHGCLCLLLLTITCCQVLASAAGQGGTLTKGQRVVHQGGTLTAEHLNNTAQSAAQHHQQPVIHTASSSSHNSKPGSNPTNTSSTAETFCEGSLPLQKSSCSCNVGWERQQETGGAGAVAGQPLSQLQTPACRSSG